ncbi:threonine ammonia-lyase [Salinigranum sp. GCM10025319]|uniref:threonine ammonia-lyase n=1 Tax=Salinigranum sp. GCM10025319 TaxID=3252687 RepID=UPI0036208A58
MTADEVVTLADVEAARDRLADVVHRTPLDGSTTLADRCGADAVGLKLENTQRTGSFKIRGAYNAMSRLSDAERERGVVTASAGNHAQGVALAGRLLDVDATVVVPEVTPAAKIEATRGYGAEVLVEGADYERSYERALELADEGRTFVHPFDDGDVIAGQGTVGLELREQFDPDTVLVSIGGGGLISGIATALKAHDPNVRVVGVQPEGAAHAKPSLSEGRIHRLDEVDTVAEGIADARLLEKTFAVIRERVDDVVAVTDRDLAVATTVLAERAKTVAEAAGAAPVAALLSRAVDVEGERVACVVSGGNTNLTDHAELTRIGLSELGRYVDARLALADWPTDVGAVVETVEADGAELDVLERARRTASDEPNRTPVRIGIEGSGPEHLVGVLRALDSLSGVAVVEHSLDPTNGAAGDSD